MGKKTSTWILMMWESGYMGGVFLWGQVAELSTRCHRELDNRSKGFYGPEACDYRPYPTISTALITL